MKGSPFDLGFLISGIVLLIIAARMLRRAVASKNWPTTMGKVISAGVVRQREGRIALKYCMNTRYMVRCIHPTEYPLGIIVPAIGIMQRALWTSTPVRRV